MASKSSAKKGDKDNVEEEKEVDLGPRSLIVRRGKVGKNVRSLIMDLRNAFGPNTASKVKERTSNTLKEFLHACSVLAVTHLVTLTQNTKKSSSTPNLRIARATTGPTLTFNVEKYALSADIRRAAKKVIDPTSTLSTNPLVVLNNFDVKNSPNHIKIAALTFQAMFPALNVKTLLLSSCKRVLLFHYNQETENIELRHYLIKTAPAGASRVGRKLLKVKVAQDMHKKEDFGDILETGSQGYATSDSEYEDEDAKVALPENETKANILLKLKKKRSGKDINGEAKVSVVKLYEIGPRVVLKLTKVESGVFGGEVQYHAYNKRTPEEVEKQKKEYEEKMELKKKRREEQENNVKRKREEEEEAEQRKIAKRQRRVQRQAEKAKESESLS